MRFCTQCGQVAAAPAAPPAGPGAAAPNGRERILGIVPFLEQGLLSVVHYTLIVTDHRLIFCTWDAGSDEAMSDADDAAMQQSCDISETVDEIAHFRAKDWSDGPWQRYLPMVPDAIIAGAPGTIVVPLGEVVDAGIVCETRTSTQDTLSIRSNGQELAFDLMYSQGPFLFRILSPILGGKLSLEEHLHQRRGIDRLLSGQEYK
jgi:hypothetical protein